MHQFYHKYGVTALCTILFLFWIPVRAQLPAKGHFAKDESGKYTWYEVVDSGLPKDSLFLRVHKFLKQEKIKLTNQSDSGIAGTGSFQIERKALVATQPAARVGYTFNLEWKAGKYRYWLTNYTLTPFKRNRYGQFELQPGINKSLEEEPGSLNRKAWESDLKLVERAATMFAARMRLAVSRTILAPGTKPAINKEKEW